MVPCKKGKAANGFGKQNDHHEHFPCQRPNLLSFKGVFHKSVSPKRFHNAELSYYLKRSQLNSSASQLSSMKMEVIALQTLRNHNACMNLYRLHASNRRQGNRANVNFPRDKKLNQLPSIAFVKDPKKNTPGWSHVPPTFSIKRTLPINLLHCFRPKE